MDQLQRVVDLVNVAAAPHVLGIYLHGSSVHGGLKPASDLDVLAVTATTLDDAERRRLVGGLLDGSGPRSGFDWRSVELTVVVQSAVRPWRYPPMCDFLYGDWLRDEIAANGPPRPQPLPNLAIEIPVVLAGEHALQGPPPAVLLDPVPPADVARASVDGISALLDDLPGDTRNVVLTLARIWTTLATGEIVAKDVAAEWALARLPPEHRPVLAYARELYLTRRYSEETWPDALTAQVRPHVDAVLTEIARLPL